MKQKFSNILPWIIVWVFAILVLTTFGRPLVLRSYIELGIGDCQKVPILCIVPTEEFINPSVDREFLKSLTRHKFPGIDIFLPKSFTAVKEQIHRAYYKKNKRRQTDATAYLLHQNPDFFTSLFPQLKKEDIKSNFEFLRRLAFARTKDVGTISDATFVILKSIFTPDLGSGNGIKIAEFVLEDKRGFIAYNYAGQDNYFNCDIVNKEGELFKVYLKDKGAKLDLKKVLAIISTLNKNPKTGY